MIDENIYYLKFLRDCLEQNVFCQFSTNSLWKLAYYRSVENLAKDINSSSIIPRSKIMNQTRTPILSSELIYYKILQGFLKKHYKLSRRFNSSKIQTTFFVENAHSNFTAKLLQPHWWDVTASSELLWVLFFKHIQVLPHNFPIALGVHFANIRLRHCFYSVKKAYIFLLQQWIHNTRARLWT